MLHVNEIQSKTMKCIAAVGGHILHSTIVSLSSEPDDINFDPTVRVNTFIIGVIMTREQAFVFRECCNVNKIWIKWTFWPLAGDSEKFEYSLTATEKRNHLFFLF